MDDVTMPEVEAEAVTEAPPEVTEHVPEPPAADPVPDTPAVDADAAAAT